MNSPPAKLLTGCSVLPSMNPQSDVTSKKIAKDGTKDTPNKATGDRFGFINTLVDFTLATLTRNEMAVWLVLWRDTKEGTARTAQTDIARRAGIGRRTAVRITKQLEAKGLLVMVHRGGLNRGMNVYRVYPLAKPP